MTLPESLSFCSRCALALVVLLAPMAAQTMHTDPLNLDPMVKDGYEHFYNLDYDGALAIFDKVQKAHPQEPIAYDYLLTVTVFRELYHQDLLDTTYYAHDSFLTTKRADVHVAEAVRQRIEFLFSTAQRLADERIKANGQDKNAYFARGYAKGMHAAYLTLVDHSWVASARQGLAARNDSEAALKIDPEYADAKMAVGIQQFAVASLPGFIRMMIGIFGVGGNKEKGLALIRESAEHGVVTSVEARTALSLFLRHDARYPEALVVQHGLAQQYPRDYLYRLEEANLAKDAGNGPQAISIYKAVLADARRPGYFIDPRLQMAWFGLADTERGQNLREDAAKHYLEAALQPTASDWLKKRAQLNAGEMFDLMHDRANALKQYELASAAGGDQSQSETARKYLKTPYSGT